MMAMSDLVEFLRARLDEDEKIARDASGARLWRWSVHDLMIINDAGHMQRFTPSRVLAEVEAKRRIMDLHGPANSDGFFGDPEGHSGGCSTCTDLDYAGLATADGDWPCKTLCLLAVPYADHPDYDPAWRN